MNAGVGTVARIVKEAESMGDMGNDAIMKLYGMIKDKVEYYLHFAEFGEDEDKRNYEVSYKKRYKQ